jgi:dihydroorotate dehydrogenase (fumarate)
MPDLSTTYLGLVVRSPLVASAGPVTGNRVNWPALEDSGVGAVVLPSLFEEEIEHDLFATSRPFDQSSHLSAEAMSFFPDLDAVAAGPNRHLDLVEDAVSRLSVPVIVSLNGTTPGGWVRYARSLESAGAHAIELNVYDTVSDPRVSAAEVEERLIELVTEVRAQVTVPLAVKLGPWFTALGNLVARVHAAGADGVVLFNRFYQPDIDLDSLDVVPRLALSAASEMRLPLYWVAALRGHVDGCALAASTGVHSGADVAKLLLAGADAVMTTSALLRHGPAFAGTMLAELSAWMTEHDYDSVDQLRGSVSRLNVPDPGAYDRHNYFQVIHSWPS